MMNAGELHLYLGSQRDNYQTNKVQYSVISSSPDNHNPTYNDHRTAQSLQRLEQKHECQCMTLLMHSNSRTSSIACHGEDSI
jgi:hypothetical protein